MGRPNLNDDTPSEYDDPTTPHLDPHQPGDGAYMEPSPSDVAHPELTDPIPPEAYPPDAYSQGQRQRANWHNGSNYVVVMLTCDCGRQAGYYGIVDDAPDRFTWKCDRCA